MIGETSNIKEDSKKYHLRYSRAINNPIRRTILNAIKNGNITINDLQYETGLEKQILNWHLSILEWGFCIEKEIEKGESVYKITKEGKVIDHLNKT